ncbi:hypothetical protein RchiOBHm_Chr5g0078531 [Rosa chinensis]|uniref:Uncharacterized protein n=1 Tax=Rosa chinensis TaxID=74649 RepID=A0A2P6QMA0_ROSCH|nr:hypothetical protein RchiOBHm_Chr5g0078531 [Rosa chinensis]
MPQVGSEPLKLPKKARAMQYPMYSHLCEPVCCHCNWHSSLLLKPLAGVQIINPLTCGNIPGCICEAIAKEHSTTILLMKSSNSV